MKAKSTLRFADEKLLSAFEDLKNAKGDERRLYEWLNRAFDDLEENCFCGV